MPVLIYPHIDPILVRLGPLAIHWYAIAYIVGLLLGWRIMRRLVRRDPVVAAEIDVDDFLTWATLGVVLGGRLGYVLFYQPGFYLAHPSMILAVWEGGMSFHGGMLGVIASQAWFARSRGRPFWQVMDFVAPCVPLDRKSTRLNSSHSGESRMPSSA